MTRRYYPEEETDPQLDYLLNSGLTFIDNLRCAILDEELALGENTIQHGLGYVPIGYIIIYREERGDIFGTRQEDWTTEELFLTSSVTSQKARLIVV